MSLLSSLTTIRYYTNTDPYHYTIDNRPLGDLKANIDAIATFIDTGVYTTFHCANVDITGGTISGTTISGYDPAGTAVAMAIALG